MQITNYITLLNSFKLMSVNLDRTSTGSLFQRVAALYWKKCVYQQYVPAQWNN